MLRRLGDVLVFAYFFLTSFSGYSMNWSINWPLGLQASRTATATQTQIAARYSYQHH
jgi:hypothetical protein